MIETISIQIQFMSERVLSNIYIDLDYLDLEWHRDYRYQDLVFWLKAFPMQMYQLKIARVHNKSENYLGHTTLTK